MSFKAVLGGAMAGFGEGLADRADARREAAKEARARAFEIAQSEKERLWRSQEAAAERAWREGQNAADRDARGEEITSTFTNSDGEVTGVTRSGERRGLGPIDQPKEPDMTSRERNALAAGLEPGTPEYQDYILDRDPDEAAGGGAAPTMDAGEQRIFDKIVSQYTNPNTKETDWSGVISHMRGIPEERGGTRFNVIADWLAGDVGAQMSPAQAGERAEREAAGRSGFFGEGFEEGEDRESFIERRARELRYGEGGAPGDQAPAGSAEPGQAPAGAPAGEGTQESPYQASTQADVEWFKANAPAGAVIMVDGTLYQK